MTMCVGGEVGKGQIEMEVGKCIFVIFNNNKFDLVLPFPNYYQPSFIPFKTNNNYLMQQMILHSLPFISVLYFGEVGFWGGHT